MDKSKKSNNKGSSQKKTKKMSPRIAAISLLNQLLKQQGSLASLLPDYNTSFNPQELSFIKECCYGCCRWYPQLEAVLSRLLTQPLKRKDSDIKAVLLLGIYQLQFMRVAEHAAINESVNAVNYFKKPWAKKLVNAILRSYQRQSQKTEAELTLFEQVQADLPSAHPLWLEKKIRSAWPEQADTIFRANNQHPPLTLRVNQQHFSREQYLAQLDDKQLNAKAAPFSSEGMYLEKPVAVSELPQFEQGAVSVQDEAAQLAANLLRLAPGLNVLDACCAPGGKTCHIGETETQLGSLMAIDLEARRLEKVEENLKRLGVRAKVKCGDAANPDAWLSQEEKQRGFDRILLDAPCSATGIIRRQPDIKLLRQADQVQALVELQLSLLKALWPLLVDGGILLYATCSILPEENTQLIERFMATQSNVTHIPIDASWGIEQPFGRQLFPVDQAVSGPGHDGFYYALLEKHSA